MTIFVDLLGSLVEGVLMAVLLTGIVFLLGRALCSKCSRSAGAWAVLIVLFLFLTAQSTMFCGAIHLKGYVSEVHDVVSVLLPAPSSDEGDDDDDDVVDYGAMIDDVADEYPMLKPFLQRLDVHALSNYVVDGGHSVADYMADNLTSSLNYYMLRRVLWMLGSIIVALVLIALMKKKDYQDSSAYGTDDYDTGASYGGADEY